MALIGVGTSVLSGPTTFNDLTSTAAGKTIQFTAGQTFTVAGAFTIVGAANNLITLESTVPLTQWTLDNAGNVELVSFAAVMDGGVGSNDITATTSRDNGNNAPPAPGWIFPATTLNWDGSASTDWSTGANWDLGYVPNATDHAFITNAGSQPATMAAATTIDDLTIAAGASADTAGFTLTINGIYDNQGTLFRQGGDTVSQTDTNSGATNYRGVGGVMQDYGTSDYFDLIIGAAFPYTAVAGDLIISAGSADIACGANLTVLGQVSGAGTLDASTGGTVDVGTDLLVATYSATPGLTQVASNWNVATFIHNLGQVVLDGTGSLVPNGQSFFDLTKSSSRITTLAGNVAVTNDLSIALGGTLAAGGNGIALTGNWTNDGTFNAGAGTVDFVGGGTSVIAGSSATTFNNLTSSLATRCLSRSPERSP